MTLENLDEHYMSIALKLAEQGRYTCDPNPMVGCVIVRHQEIIGQGYHVKAGEPHAEVNAIRDALSRHDSLDCTDIYVTLEPCSHTGRTPPCCEALLQHRFKRVIVACQDPNPLVGGRGIARLQTQFEVTLGILEQEALELNHAFFHRMLHQRPWVQLKMGSSLDGRTALANGKSQWITSAESRQDVHRLRLAASAVLTGKGTMLADNAQLDARESHLGFAPTRQPLRIILDENLETLPLVQLQNKEQKSPLQHTVIVSSKAQDITHNRLTFFQQDTRDLYQLLQKLASQQINSLMIEAGATLAGYWIQENCVDEIVLYMAPTLLGQDAKALLNIEELQELPQDRHWYFHNIELIGTGEQDLKLTLRKKHS